MVCWKKSGGGLEENSSYINLGILRLDSFLVKNMDGDYALKDYYAKIDEIIDYAKKKTKIKYFNSNSDENIPNSLNKTLRGIEYDEEKNIFYMDLEKSDRDYDSTYSKKNRTNDEKLYRVYFKLNYVYDGKRTADVDFNYIINDIKSKNENEIDDIKLVDDEFYGESGYNYLNVEITDKNGNKYKSKIIIETDQNQDYDQSGNINYDKPILTEEEIKNGQILNEHYNEIRDFIKSKDIFKPKNNFYIRNSVLNLDNNYKYYISLTDGQYSKNFYLKTVENEENNIDLNNLVVDDEVHYLQDINSIINDPIFGYDTLRVKTIIDNGQKYNLISAENNLLPLSSFVYKKYPNEKIVNVDKKEKDNDIYLIFNLTNNKQYVLKLNKIIIPNIKLNIDNDYLSSQNQDDIKKTIKYFYKNQIENFQNFTLFKENGQTKVKVKFEYSNYQSNNFNKYLTVNINSPDGETVDLFDPSTIQDKQEHLYNINIKYNPNVEDEPYEPDYDTCEPLEEFEEVPKLPKVPDEDDEIKDQNNGCNNGCDSPDPVYPPDPGPPPVFPPDPISPEEPNDPKPDPKVTPSDLPKPKPENPVTPSDLPKPKPNNPNTPTPKESTPRIPNEVVGKIPNEVVEKTPITIVTNNKKQSVNDETRKIENTTGLPNIQRKEIKTGDNLFNIIYLIGTFGILAYFISLLKNKYKHKLN